MSPFLENLVLACIVVIILFFGYHIAMHLIHKQTKQIVMEMNSSKHVPTVENLPGVHEVAAQPQAQAQQPQQQQQQQPQQQPQQPEANDPNVKVDGSATFTTDLRLPENLYGKHAYVESTDKPLPAQNAETMGDISAWDGDSAQPFSLV